MIKQFEFFKFLQSFLSFFLSYYKKTRTVDGDCISFNMYRNTESSIVLLKRWRGDYKKEEYWQIYQHSSYLEEFTQIEWSISSKKQNNRRAYETKIGDKEHQFDYCFEFDTNTKYRFVRISFDRLSKFCLYFPLFILQYTKKKTIKTYILVIFFHWLEIEQIEKIKQIYYNIPKRKR